MDEQFFNLMFVRECTKTKESNQLSLRFYNQERLLEFFEFNVLSHFKLDRDIGKEYKITMFLAVEVDPNSSLCGENVWCTMHDQPNYINDVKVHDVNFGCVQSSFVQKTHNGVEYDDYSISIDPKFKEILDDVHDFILYMNEQKGD